MTRGLGLLSNQEDEMVIPKWWMWWKWLMHSSPAWKASPEGLKALTLIPNPIRISPQTHITYGWRRVLMHKHYNMSMHQYFLCFVTMLGCVLFDNLCWKLFVCLFFFKCFYIVAFDQSFLIFVSKIHKHIKSRKSKKFYRHCCVLSQAYFALYLCTNGPVHLRV